MIIILLLLPIILIGAFGLTIYFKVKNGKRLNEIQHILKRLKEAERDIITKFSTVTTEGKHEVLRLYERAGVLYFEIKNTPDRHSKEMADAYMADMLNVYNRLLK